MTPRRTVTLVATSMRVSLMTAMQYRADFLVEGLMSVYWLAWNLLPLVVLYGAREQVAGWDQASALIVIGAFVILRAFIEGVISPSLVEFVERIRTGAFDYVLLKPADAQLLVSTARFVPWRLVDLLGGVAIVVIGFAQLGRAPAPLDLVLGAVLLGCGGAAIYALYIVAAAASFWVVRLDNLAFLLSAIFDTARWPVQVFRGAWRVVFTFVLPLALMTTYPAMALLGRLDASTAVACAAGAVAMLAVARLAWRTAIRSYTSASS
ncbi:MAG: ABC-2 family transporter protein [Kofleriaceae bacterium]